MGLNFKQQDKIMHIIFAMLCAFICSALIAHTTTTPLPAIIIGATIGCMGGFLTYAIHI